ncbi:hybrid sensor histidine kinase/response regulator [Natrinema versiforme]|uniref:histidine kinase n=1 Tax=Natrinema versiforme JCM 10478 TaxID=1227496 RepID=L9Y523_9EURY|nr:PAS domain S-box protein [Natrinema versiforme]ELY67968.1 PAS sensor protein [Natrinema versiforme JCM 10478]
MATFGPTRFERPTTVVYADPAPDDRRRVADGLESIADGLTVVPVATLAELRDAVADASGRTCVVTEYQFAETDALSLYDRIRADGIGDVPIVLYTADGDERLASDAVTAGFSGYVPKGLEDSLERLVAQLRAIVNQPVAPNGGQTAGSRLRPDTERGSLRAERDQFAALFEHSPDAVIVTRRDDPNRIIDVNPAFEAIFGHDRGDIAGGALDDILVPNDAEPVSMADTVGLGTIVTEPVERLTVDGRRDFFLRGFAAEVAGEVYEYAIYTDISDQKRRERELERYRTLVDAVGDSMYVLDETGRIEMVNDAMADALGTTRADLVGQPPSRYMPAEDVERATELLLDILADDDRTWGTFEMEFQPVDGEPFVVENNVAPIVAEDGSLAGSVGAIRDISDRIERERQIRKLHEGTRRLMAAERTAEVARVASEIARDALSLEINSVHLYEERTASRTVSADGPPVAADPSLESRRERGILVPAAATDRTEALFGSVPAIGPGDGISWDAFEAGETIVHGDVRRAENVRNPETAIRSEAHIPLGTMGIFIVSSTTPNDFDPETITLARILAANVEAALEQARREAELAERTAELERQNDRLEAFASTVSHDLRNPLTLAAGHLENLEAHVDEEGERYRKEIDWALERMDDLIENVLTLARSGQRLTATEPVALDEVVDQARRTVDPDLDLVREEPLPTVEADADRLLVCFENVFRNARDHVGDDVTITIETTDDGFAIADDGPGVPPGERGDILESGYSTSPDGTGFGLAIVSEVVEAHGWSVTVGESDAGGLRLAVSLEE